MTAAAPEARPRTLAEHAPVIFPAAMLLVFFVVPFGIMLAVSFFQRVQGAFYEPSFSLDNYGRFLSPFFADVLAFSLGLSALAAVVCVGLGFPFTYLLTRLERRRQIVWLVFLLSVLSLSEVIVGFAWSTLLSRSAGLSNLLVALGLMEQAESWSPGFAALLIGMCYLAFPYTVLLLYPSLVRLDRELVEAAMTMGASPVRAFFTVVIGASRNAILSGLILAFVFTLGIYLLPQLLGRPQHWTISVMITDQAIYQSNLPFGAAMAIFLMLVSLALIGLTLLLGRRRAA
jgi:putative spermidine/putrescine transport system permease protein